MGVHVIQNERGEAVLYDSVTGYAFGPVFDNFADPDEFLRWLRDDGVSWAREKTDMRPLQSDGRDARDWDLHHLGVLVRRWKEVRDEELG